MGDGERVFPPRAIVRPSGEVSFTAVLLGQSSPLSLFSMEEGLQNYSQAK